MKGTVWRIVGLVVVGLVFVDLGCSVGQQVAKSIPPKSEEVRLVNPPPSTPTASQAAAKASNTPTPRPTSVPTPSPVPPTPSPTPTPASGADIAFVRDGNLWLANVNDGRQVPLALGGGNSFPTWAPDGRSVLFVHASGATSELYVVGADGRDRRRLAGGDGLYVDPEWSPSGDAVLFVVKRDTNKDGKMDERDAPEVWLVNADGSSPRKIAEGTSSTWAPEGLRIAFTTPGSLQQDAPYRRANAVKVINRQGKNEWTLVSTGDVPTEVTLGGSKFNSGVFLLRNPAWSRTLKLIAFAATGHTGMVLTISEKASDLRPLALNYEGGFGRSTWSPGGDRLAYESNPASGANTIVIGSPSQARPATVGGPRSGLSVHSPTWSSDGRFLAFVQDSGTKYIGVVAADGEGLRQIATGNVSEPDWNPRSRISGR